MKSIVKKIWTRLGFVGTLMTLVVALIAVVGFQNMEPVDIDFLFWDLIEVPKLYFIAALTSIGFLLGLVVGYRGRR